MQLLDLELADLAEQEAAINEAEEEELWHLTLAAQLKHLQTHFGVDLPHGVIAHMDPVLIKKIDWETTNNLEDWDITLEVRLCARLWVNLTDPVPLPDSALRTWAASMHASSGPWSRSHTTSCLSSATAAPRPRHRGRPLTLSARLPFARPPWNRTRGQLVRGLSRPRSSDPLLSQVHRLRNHLARLCAGQCIHVQQLAPIQQKWCVRH